MNTKDYIKMLQIENYKLEQENERLKEENQMLKITIEKLTKTPYIYGIRSS